MSREQKLSKKIAHTLLAMSIVYSGGMNVLCNTAFAAGKGDDGADKSESVAVTESVYTGTYTGNNGADGASGRTGESGGNGGKMVLELTGSENVANKISFTATGGNGGEGMRAKENSSIPFGGNGGSGGDAAVDLVVSGTGVSHMDVALTASGGSGANCGLGDESSYADITSDMVLGNGGAGGKAEVSITVSGASYTAGDITLTATGGTGGEGKSKDKKELIVDADGSVARVGGGGAGGNAVATGLSADGTSSSVKTVTAADVVITATGGNGGVCSFGSGYIAGAFGGIGGAAEAYGIKTAMLLKQEIAFAVKSIDVTAMGGDSGDTGSIIHESVKKVNAGGKADAYGIFNNKGSLNAAVAGDITASATGGAAGVLGNGKEGEYGSSGADGGDGGNGSNGLTGSTAVAATAVLEVLVAPAVLV